MKKNTFKVRGYESVSHLEFEASDVPKLGELLGNERLLGVVNSYLTAHEWNSNFEAGLCDLAEKAGHARTTEKDGKGKITSRETNSSFLKRTEFKLDKAGAQALADSIPYPPVSKPRGVDKEAVERLQLAQTLYGDAERLERFRLRVAAAEQLDGSKIDWPDFNDEESSEEEDVAKLAETIRMFRLAI